MVSPYQYKTKQTARNGLLRTRIGCSKRPSEALGFIGSGPDDGFKASYSCNSILENCKMRNRNSLVILVSPREGMSCFAPRIRLTSPTSVYATLECLEVAC
jgi:hypothetical protein